MSRWLIVLMIFLLPLRGWAGDLMSVDVAVSSLSPHAASVMPAHCPMHAEAKADPSSQAPSGVDECNACGLCLPMAEPMTDRLDAIAFAAHASPTMGEVVFISATLTPSVRPPIS